MQIHLIDEEEHNLDELLPSVIRWKFVNVFIEEVELLHIDDCLLIIHTSDPLWDLRCSKCDGDERDNLEYLIEFVHSKNVRFIFFSGGATSYRGDKGDEKPFDNLRIKFNDIIEGQHWIFLTATELETEVNWQRVKETTIDNATRISIFVKSRAADYDYMIPPVSLDILLQGYLLGLGCMPHHDRELSGTQDIERYIDNLFVSTTGKDYWFDPITKEDLSSKDGPFTQGADKVLEGTFKIPTKWKDRFKHIACSEESKRAAQKISRSIKEKGTMPDDREYPGGAFRLCWELVKGGGIAYGWNTVSDNREGTGAKNEVLCELFRRAHQEFCDFWSVLNEKVPIAWKKREQA